MALQRNVPFSPSLIVWSRGVVVKLRGTVKVDIKMFLKGKRFPFGVNKQFFFVSTTLRDWLKKLAPLFHPIRGKTKPNHDSHALLFPRFASATFNYLVLIGSLYCLCPLGLAELITVVLVYDT